MERFELFRPLYQQIATGDPWPESIIEWAVDLLGRGVDTPSLRILAGLSRRSYEAEVTEYFLDTLAELNEPPITREERSLGAARVLADAILTDQTSPTKGVETVHSVAVSPLNHPPTLQPWCDLSSGFSRLAGSSKVVFHSGDELDDAIRAFCREFLSVDSGEQLKEIEAWTGSV